MPSSPGLVENKGDDGAASGGPCGLVGGGAATVGEATLRVVRVGKRAMERFKTMEAGTAGAKFPLGHLVATPGACEALTQEEMTAAVRRHVQGDWGEVDKGDWRENDLSLKQGFRLLSAYTSQGGEKFWILTEADRSVTTILLPSEY